MRVRQPAVEGAFYPGDPRELDGMVRELLAAAPAPEDERLPKALIVPHAGYVFSGEVAARAYATLRRLRERVRRVVLLGPAHRVPVRGLAAPAADAFATPLGVVSLDRAALADLADLPQVVVSDEAHALEHSLEVQLPFLQRALGSFSLVPLVVGEASDGEVAAVLERLWGGPETLIVISSDLSHYYDYATARRLDARTCQAIESLDPRPLDFESACGRIPVRGLLCAARTHDLAARTLDLRSSGDTAGPRDRVVGYGAWAFVPRSAPGAGTGEAEERGGVDRRERETEASGASEASAREDALLLEVARRSIAHGLEWGRPLRVALESAPPVLRSPGACFVTLRDPHGGLRGCIGSLEVVRPLVVDVAENAFAAAFRDPRMRPVSPPELDTLRVGLSILGPQEPIAVHTRGELVAALRPGRDGLVLADGERRGTLLPQVWGQLADPGEFVGAVWQKAGLPADHWSPSVRAWRYEVRPVEEP